MINLKMLFMKKYIYISLFVFLIVSCSEVKSNYDNVPIENIDFFSLKQKKISDLIEQKNEKYILLKSKDDMILGRIDKAMIHLGRIYLMDKRLKSLVVYDDNGYSITKVGQFGQGPKEYINISDFDVDDNGNVYILDGRLNKVLLYNSSFECVDERKLPFDADVLAILDQDTIMYGLSSWNSRKAKGSKIALVNKNNDVINHFFKYTDAVDPSFWISNYLLGKSNKYVSYNQTIDNDVSVFSNKVELKKIFRFNFDNENVPEDNKMDIEKKIANYDKYTMIRKILSVTDKYIIGFIWEHRQTKIFVIDYISKICYVGDTFSDFDRRQGCGYFDGGLISYIDTENEIYPDSVNEHVRNENWVLRIQPLK